jgi:hypothetical protein
VVPIAGPIGEDSFLGGRQVIQPRAHEPWVKRDQRNGKSTETLNLVVRSEDPCAAVTEIRKGRPERPLCAVSWDTTLSNP